MLLVITNLTSCNKNSTPGDEFAALTTMHRAIGGQEVSLAAEMLCFRDSAHFTTVYDSLENAYSRSDEGEQYIDTNEFVMIHPVFSHFENQFPAFKSLRSEVAAKVTAAMINETVTEHNPEQDYIGGSAYRVFLNKYSEIKIGTIIYKYLGRTMLVQIENNDLEALYALRAGASPATLGSNVSFSILEVNEGTANCNTNVRIETKANDSNLSTMEANAIITGFQGAGNQTDNYTINWGDGSPESPFSINLSTQGWPNVKHTYAHQGSYMVRVRRTGYVSCDGFVKKVTIGNGECGSTLGLTLAAQVASNGTDVTVTPTVTGGTPIRICWKLDPGSNGTDYIDLSESDYYGITDWPISGGILLPKLDNGNHEICVAVCTANGCYAEACVTVNINVCCKGNDETKFTDYYYTSNRWLHTELGKNTGPWLHRVYSEAKHYVKRRRDNGKGDLKWRETKADQITILQDGQVRKESNNENCRGESFSVYAYKQKNTAQSISADKNVGKKFGSSDTNIPTTTFTVKHNNVNYTTTITLSSCN